MGWIWSVDGVKPSMTLASCCSPLLTKKFQVPKMKTYVTSMGTAYVRETGKIDPQFRAWNKVQETVTPFWVPETFLVGGFNPSEKY